MVNVSFCVCFVFCVSYSELKKTEQSLIQQVSDLTAQVASLTSQLSLSNQLALTAQASINSLTQQVQTLTQTISQQQQEMQLQASRSLEETQQLKATLVSYQHQLHLKGVDTVTLASIPHVSSSPAPSAPTTPTLSPTLPCASTSPGSSSSLLLSEHNHLILDASLQTRLEKVNEQLQTRVERLSSGLLLSTPPGPTSKILRSAGEGGSDGSIGGIAGGKGASVGCVIGVGVAPTPHNTPSQHQREASCGKKKSSEGRQSASECVVIHDIEEEEKGENEMGYEGVHGRREVETALEESAEMNSARANEELKGDIGNASLTEEEIMASAF